MPVKINDITYYRTTEACQLVGIGRSTLLRWLSDGVINNPPCRDRRGWRLFSDDDIKAIEKEVNHIKQPVSLVR